MNKKQKKHKSIYTKQLAHPYFQRLRTQKLKGSGIKKFSKNSQIFSKIKCNMHAFPLHYFVSESITGNTNAKIL